MSWRKSQGLWEALQIGGLMDMASLDRYILGQIVKVGQKFKKELVGHGVNRDGNC